MPTVRLTERGIQSLKPGKWLVDYWDQLLPGFCVRVSKTGKKSFGIRYYSNGKKRRLTIGSFPAYSLAEARDEARRLLEMVQRGVDPQGEDEEPQEAEKALTFAELASEYMERHAKPKKRSWREDDRMLRVDLLPRWADTAAESIDRREVAALLDSIVDRGSPIAANRTKALVSKIYNFGIGRGLVERNPAFGIPQPAQENRNDRVLSEADIRSLWAALNQHQPVMAGTFRLRLLTAQRGQEVLAMRWSDIEGAWWTVPAEIAKNGLSHRVPLSPQSLAVLEELQPITGSNQWVFASPRKPGAHITAVQKAAERLEELSGVGFVPHDLRRTAASFMTSLGVPRLVVSKILNHVESGVTAVYDRHSYDEEKREALEKWGTEVERILSHPPA